MRVFGLQYYAHNQERKGDKFSSRSTKCVFVGYAYDKKGWKLFDLKTRYFSVSQYVELIVEEYSFTVDGSICKDFS